MTVAIGVIWLLYNSIYLFCVCLYVRLSLFLFLSVCLSLTLSWGLFAIAFDDTGHFTAPGGQCASSGAPLVCTVFSASNYSESDNKGAYLVSGWVSG